MTQLGLDGAETTHPIASHRPLSGRQRDVLRYMRHKGVATPSEVGVLMHTSRDATTTSKPRYFSSDGWSALKRLERRGLVRRVDRGRWMPIVHDERWLT